MPSPNVSFAKISANPTADAWSQSHNAGSLFLVISLTTHDEDKQKELPALGKQLISDLQAEFFTLEDKTLETIEQAITTATQTLKGTTSLSLSLAYVKDNILYVFIQDGGKVLLKRDGKTGTLLESGSTTPASASGYLQTGDIIMLQTKQFASSVPQKTLAEALEYTLPSDIAETLSPHVHGGEEGAASAVIISFQGVPQVTEEEEAEEAERESEMEPTPTNDEAKYDVPKVTLRTRLSSLLSALPLPHVTLNHRHKLILSVAVVIAGILLVSIFLAITTQQNKKSQTIFNEAFASAKKDYNEGLSLLSLNKALAREDFQRAKETIVNAKKELPDDSSEERQLKALEAKVDEKLMETQNAKAADVKEVDAEKAALLALIKDKKALAITEDEENMYYLTDKAIFSVNKDTGDEEELYANEDNWDNAKSLAVFSRNLYVLDPSAGIVKFVPTANGYAGSSYFSGDAPDLENAVSMAIDASVWILFKDGRVEKYTRGEKNAFSLSGLTADIKQPLALITSPEIEKLYVLDRATSSILKISKNGSFEESYQTEVLKDADFFAVSSDEASAYILANDKLYEITL